LRIENLETEGEEKCDGLHVSWAKLHHYQLWIYQNSSLVHVCLIVTTGVRLR